MGLGFLVSIWVVLVEAVGMPLAIVIVLISLTLIVLIASYLTNAITNSLLGEGTTIERPPIDGSRPLDPVRLEKLRLMGTEKLAAHIEKKPKDDHAVWVMYEILDHLEEQTEAAEMLARYLDMDTGRRVEELGALHHKLADIYMHKLDDPEKARATLLHLISRAPRSETAHTTRERIRRIEGREDLIERMPNRMG